MLLRGVRHAELLCSAWQALQSTTLFTIWRRHTVVQIGVAEHRMIEQVEDSMRNWIEFFAEELAWRETASPGSC